MSLLDLFLPVPEPTSPRRRIEFEPPPPLKVLTPKEQRARDSRNRWVAENPDKIARARRARRKRLHLEGAY